ncbi:MAG TPA: O-antigen ligase family protein [Opitutaceae bacterium]|nr:O-antigen ligase family protein [Opitutaceae bacterium]
MIAATIVAVVPWFFGGGGPEGYHAISWGGRLCLVPLALWGTAAVLRREQPGAEFWVPVICWALLSVQVIASLNNPSHVSQAPWEGSSFDRIPHQEGRPSSAFPGATLTDGNLWLAFGLLALTAQCTGFTRKQLRALLWLLVSNATILALVGIPFKFSGVKAMLGKWEMPEWYFYSTFLYHNHWCAYALLAAAAATGLFVSSPRAVERGAVMLMGIVIAASAPLSTSRLGTLAMLAFGLFVVAVLMRERLALRQSHFRVSRSLVIAAVVGIIAVAGTVFYFYKVRGQPGGHRTWVGILTNNPFGLRQTFVEDTIPMLKDKPWFGWGLGGYGAAFRSYQRPETIIVHNEGRITLYDHIHNDWVERLAELGLVGFSLFLIPGVLWFRSIRRRPPLPPMERWLFVGCMTVLIFAVGDMAFVNPVVAASFGLFFGLATAGRERATY